ncbi:leucine-rich repeat and IQ domain-containing protein 1 [Erpetoichthys calabaricus]|uniref:leucine-rich repeat and IQ domain-containing protein 1 n=1 Tax=Erpetoichthys calabaricus TaxID=27687 RepID=UPI0010A03713|nr:leucine-rich repeat and IQ domain-containing protein 1 [Erpetoichthys calabaricus]
MDDSQSIDKIIEQELLKINVGDLKLQDLEDSSDDEPVCQDNIDTDELPESLIAYFQLSKDRVNFAENVILQDLEDTELGFHHDDKDCIKSKQSYTDEDVRKRLILEAEEILNLSSEFRNERFSDTSNEEKDCFENIINTEYEEVEKRCRSELQVWEDKQSEMENKRIQELEILKEQQEREREKEDERKRWRQKEFDEELKRIQDLNMKQKYELEEKVRQEEELLQSELRIQEEVIINLQEHINSEKKAFEEQQAMEKFRLEEQNQRAAIKIQSVVRGFLSRKKYAFVLNHIKSERLKKKELLLRLIKEQKEKEIRRNKRLEEQKLLEEKERKRKEEEERLKLEEQIKRHHEYETKKVEERQRLEREKLVKLEQVKNQKEHEENKFKEESMKLELEENILHRKSVGTLGEDQEKENKEKHKSQVLDVQVKLNFGYDKKTKEHHELLEKEKTPKVPKVKKQMETNKPKPKEELNCSEVDTNSVEYVKSDEKLKKHQQNLVSQEQINHFHEHAKKTEKEHQHLEREKIKTLKKESEKENQKDKLQCLEEELNVDQMRNIYESNISEVLQEKEPLDKVLKEKVVPLVVDKYKTTVEQNAEVDNQRKQSDFHSTTVIQCLAKEGDAAKIINQSKTVEKNESLDTENNVFANGSEQNSCCVPCKTGSDDIIINSSLDSNYNVNTDKCTTMKSPSDNSAMAEENSKLSLSCATEQKRVTWMKTCIPWSRIYEENRRKKVVKRKLTQKVSSVQLPPLNEALILQTGVWNSLEQVTTVTLEDLPGCSLSTFSKCRKLQALTLRRCGLTVLEGINQCKELKYIDVQENFIQSINCQDLEKLCVLRISKNRLTSIHGLDGASNLQVLEMSYNNITRIGGLESLKKLQRLVIDHNQLINTKGLKETPTLLHLNCAYNHLSNIEGIDHCFLLQTLNLQGNNFSEPPNLLNHVLLKELYLDDNNISSLENLSLSWLPVLHLLSVSQNVITQLSPLSDLISLRKFKINNVCLSDLENIVHCLKGCQNLSDLDIAGNPFQKEAQWRSHLLNVLPGLKKLNGELAHSIEESAEICIRPPTGGFLAICESQLEEYDLLIQSQNDEFNKSMSPLDTAEVYSQQCNALMKLAEKHRLCHEYGDPSINDKTDPESLCGHAMKASCESCQNNIPFITRCMENNQDFTASFQRCMPYDQVQDIMSSSDDCQYQRKQKDKPINLKIDFLTCANEEMTNGKQCHESYQEIIEDHIDSKSNTASFANTVILNHREGLICPVVKEVHNSSQANSEVIQAFEDQSISASLEQKHSNICVNSDTIKRESRNMKEKAATVIQASWRGYILRKKLDSALSAARINNVEDDFEEIDLEDFTFDEASLEKDWITLDSVPSFSTPEQFLSHLHLPKHSSHHNESEKIPSSFQWQPQEAWVNNDSQIELTSKLQSSPKETQRSESSVSITPSCLSKDVNSVKSEKEKLILEEWGFKSGYTAQLMLKRAQKMKSKKEWQKKLLDPAVRLALFKNNENKHPPPKTSYKLRPPRADLVRAQEFIDHGILSSQKIEERKKELTYQWLHTQVSDYEISSSRIMKGDGFLPHIHPEVLNGGRVQLVASPIRTESLCDEIAPSANGSALSQASKESRGLKPMRRHSAGHSKKEVPLPLRAESSPAKKEKISFRVNPVQLSAGWGSGKKKARPNS